MPTAYLAEVSIDGGAYTVLAASETTGQDRKVHSLTGLAPGVHTATVRVTPLDASGPAVISAPLEFTVPDGDALAGTSTGTSDASASLTTAITMSGTSTGTSTVSADLSTGQAPIELSGTSTGTSDATADLTTGSGSIEASDNFDTYAVGPLGGPFSTISGMTAMQVTAVGRVTGPINQHAGSMWTASVGLSDQHAEVFIAVATVSMSGGYGCGPAVRINGGSCYAAVIDSSDDGEGVIVYTMRIVKIVEGVPQTLGAPISGQSDAMYYDLFATGDNPVTLTLKRASSHGGTYTTVATRNDSTAPISTGGFGIVHLSADISQGMLDSFSGGSL